MIIRFITLVVFLLSAKAGWSQKPYLHCGAELVQQQFRKQNAHFDEAFFSSSEKARSTLKSRTEPCTVQVVVHILKGPNDGFITNTRVQQEINRLNLAINHQNSDTSEIRSIFDNTTGNSANVNFVLANSDPQGNPTNGILRIDTEINGFGAISDLLAEAAKISDAGGSDPWDVSRYLNIWVCNTADGSGAPIVAGYATPPSGLPNWPAFDATEMIDGVLIQTEFFGALNAQNQKVVIHEVGHYLGLRHIWGDDIDCFGDDGIEDTPSMNDNSAFECPNQNTCLDNILGQDLPDMYENYMDYSFPDCQVSFTNEQAAFMEWVIDNARPNLCTGSNVGVPQSAELSITIHPNPAQSQLYIETEKNIKYSICDVAGKCHVFGEGIQPVVDLQSLPAGVYLLKCTYNNQSSTQRFVRIP